MLTGDNEKTARAIAKQIGIENIISNVNPEQKLDKIKELNKNNNVAMVGDGINDSPSLKAATSWNKCRKRNRYQCRFSRCYIT